MIASFDTGAGTFGYAKLDDSDPRLPIVDIGVLIQPPHADAKKNKTLEREQRISGQAELVADVVSGCHTVIVEQLSFPPGRFCPACKRSGQVDAIVALSLSFGAIQGVVAATRLPSGERPKLVAIRPQDWQRRLLGTKTGPVDYDRIEQIAKWHLLRQPIAVRALERITRAADRRHAYDAAMIAYVVARFPELCAAVEARAA